MEKIIFEKQINSDKLKKAAQILRNDGILIHPTENLYGFGAMINSTAAIERISHLKKRTPKKGYIVLIGDKSQLESIVQNINQIQKELMRKFWPGSLTIIFVASKQLRGSPVCPNETIAVRLVGNPITRNIIKYCNSPIISTSVNVSGNKIINEPKQIISKFSDNVDGFVIDKIHNFSLEPSTIVKEKNNKIKILRQGILKI